MALYQMHSFILWILVEQDGGEENWCNATLEKSVNFFENQIHKTTFPTYMTHETTSFRAHILSV
jgi:hypothetical protein